jgi:hypothetical protein
VRASVWNTDAEIGGGWRVVLRRMAQGEPIVLAQPTRLDLWTRGLDPATAPPTQTVPGVLASDSLSVTLELSAAEITELGRGKFEHRVIVTDENGHTAVLMRGVLTIRGAVDDL